MQSDEQAIRELIAEWQRASAAGEIEKVLPLMAEDVVFLVAGRPPMRGREAFAAAFRGMSQQVKFEGKSEVQEIQVSGTLAYAWVHHSVTITPLQGGAPMRRSGHSLSILRKEPHGKWVLIRDANLMAPEPAPA